MWLAELDEDRSRLAEEESVHQLQEDASRLWGCWGYKPKTGVMKNRHVLSQE